MAMFSESFLVRVADDRKLLGAPVLGQRRKAEGRSFNRPPDSRQGICVSVFVTCHVLTSNRDLWSRAILHLREIPPASAPPPAAEMMAYLTPRAVVESNRAAA